MSSTVVRATVALIRPEIPPNTGNIGRLCVGLNNRLELVGPLGFSLDEKARRRAGLDYWDKLNWAFYDDEAIYRDQLPREHTLLLSTKATASLYDLDLRTYSHFVFGSESSGLSPMWHDAGFALAKIPLHEGIRSFNLANAVAMSMAEYHRQCGHMTLRAEQIKNP